MPRSKRKKNIEARMKLFNPVTGLHHYPDGHREFPEGGEVGGVNNYH